MPQLPTMLHGPGDDREDAPLEQPQLRVVQVGKGQFERKFIMKMGKRHLIPRSCRPCIMPYYHAVSYAFSMSKNMAIACLFMIKALCRKV